MLDSVHSTSLPDQISEMGIPKENIVVWPKNGIEYYYPPSIIDHVFGIGPDIAIAGDMVSRNGISYTKTQLVEKVVAMLERDTAMEPVFECMLLKPLEHILGHAD